MGMYNGQYYLSNSEMNDWESMCPLVWKARHIDKVFDFEPSEAMLYGSWFETLAIGSGVGGKITEPTPAMEKSTYAERIKSQAKDCRKYLKALGGKIISKQEYIYTTIVDTDGQEIRVCGGLDVLYGYPGTDRPDVIIDLKLTGNNDNDFGKYQFGNPEKLNPQQAIHYKMIYRAKYGRNAEFEFWVFDKKPDMNQKFIGIEVSAVTELIHIEKVSRIYNEITFALSMNDWGYINTFDNCRVCPVKCNYERVLPDLIQIVA